MATHTDQEGRIVGGLLDPTYDRSYYTLVPCPRLARDVSLDEHRDCENFAGVELDPESGAYFLYCRHFD